MKTYAPQLRTKNFSSAPLRGSLGEFPMRAIVRLGSRTTIEEAYPKMPVGSPVIEINTVEAIENSRSKLLMKECFAEAGIPQADWFDYRDNNGDKYFYNLENDAPYMSIGDLPYPILAKRIFGFKGHGMVKLDNQEQLEEWLVNNNTNGYYFEEYKGFAREYRLHCTQNECFMAWRKLRKADAEDRWFFNSSNCNWVGEEHELFDRPTNWNNIVEDCLKAIKAVGLDVGSFDVRIQSSAKANPEYILVEVNSAPSLSVRGIAAYKEILTQIIQDKINNLDN